MLVELDVCAFGDFGILPIIKNWFRAFTIPQSNFAHFPL